jgi:hypothetical protein
VDDDEVEPIVEAEDRSETDGHVQSRGRVQSPEIRGNYVKFEAVALGYPSYVPAQWFVGGAIRQEERARRHASVKEIWCSGGVVR